MAVRLDPLGPGRQRIGKRQVEDGDLLPRAAPPANGDDLLIACHVDPLDGCRNAEDLGLERDTEVLLDHRVEAGALLRLPVRVDDRLLDKGFEIGLFGRPGPPLCVLASRHHGCAVLQRNVSNAPNS